MYYFYSTTRKKFTYFVGRFDGHADAPVRYGVHRPMEQPLDAAIGKEFALYRPGGRHGHRFLV